MAKQSDTKRAPIFEEEEPAALDLSNYSPTKQRESADSARKAAELAAAQSGFDRYSSPTPPATARKEAIHPFSLRIPESQFDELRIWAERVSPRDSIHRLVLKAISEKIARLESGEDRD